MDNMQNIAEGIVVGKKPISAEFVANCRRTKWADVLDALPKVASDLTVQLDLTKAENKHKYVLYAKYAIRKLARKVQFPYCIKFCEYGDVLHVWINK